MEVPLKATDAVRPLLSAVLLVNLQLVRVEFPAAMYMPPPWSWAVLPVNVQLIRVGLPVLYIPPP